MEFELGERFSSFEEFDQKLNEYSSLNKVQFWKRDALKLEKAKHRRVTLAKPSLIYYNIKMCCVYGGKKFSKNKSNKNMRNTKTRRQDCEASIQLCLSIDGQFLEITKLNVVHNHIIDSKLFDLLPRQRRLPDEIQEKASKLMRMQVNKKMLQAQLIQETGKNVLLKDLKNIAAKFNSSDKSLDNIINKLQNTYKCAVNVLQRDNLLHGIFFQDKVMCETFDLFPDVIFFDGTFKLQNANFMCFIFLIEDGNGNCEIVAVGLLAQVDLSSLEWLIDTFQNQNSKWKQTRVILADNVEQKNIFTKKFPQAHLQVSLFHVMRSFEREIMCKNVSISQEQKEWAQEQLTKLCYSNSEKEYSINYCKFIKDAPGPVVTYYDKNLHPIRREWTSIIHENGSFINSTSNGLESLNAKLTFVVQKRSSLLSFIDNFFLLLDSLRIKKESRAASACLEESLEKNSAKEQYFQLLRPYAFNLVLKQLETDVVLMEDYPNNYCYYEDSQKKPVNFSFCSCNFYSSLRLPCCHIFGVRRFMGMPLFDSSLCEKKWTKEHSVLIDQDDYCITTDTVEEQEMQFETKEDRLHIIPELTDELASILSESSGIDFQSKKKAIQDLIKCWKEGKTLSYSITDGTNAEKIWMLPTQQEDNCTQQLFVPICYEETSQQ